ncbi:MAG: T9SS type A sorting domain-containing protein [Fibrobacteria bacterium]|nr:T9SS type A sorting domain-containing protein [Fibrobacteria bacterium]
MRSLFSTGCIIGLLAGSIFGNTPQSSDNSATEPAPDGALRIGDAYEVTVDHHTGDEAKAEPKIDANDGKDKDNPYYQRHNVMRAHWNYIFGPCDHWYSSNHQTEPLEPDPSDEQWVDYKPPFDSLGAGRYKISVAWVSMSSRADTYPALHNVFHANGDTTVEIYQWDPAVESDDERCSFREIGEYDMVEGSYVRIEDTGPNSVSFAPVTFTLVGAITSVEDNQACAEETLNPPSSIMSVQHFLQYSKQISKDISWTLYDIRGNKITGITNNLNPPPGIYLLTLKSKNQMNTSKIIIQ